MGQEQDGTFSDSSLVERAPSHIGVAPSMSFVNKMLELTQWNTHVGAEALRRPRRGAAGLVLFCVYYTSMLDHDQTAMRAIRIGTTMITM